jgi:hypothetical protein
VHLLDEERHELGVGVLGAGAFAAADAASVGAAASVARTSGGGAAAGARLGICTVRAYAPDSIGGTVGGAGVGSCASVAKHAWALSSMYQGSERPACSVSM